MIISFFYKVALSLAKRLSLLCFGCHLKSFSPVFGAVLDLGNHPEP